MPFRYTKDSQPWLLRINKHGARHDLPFPISSSKRSLSDRLSLCSKSHSPRGSLNPSHLGVSEVIPFDKLLSAPDKRPFLGTFSFALTRPASPPSLSLSSSSGSLRVCPFGVIPSVGVPRNLHESRKTSTSFESFFLHQILITYKILSISIRYKKNYFSPTTLPFIRFRTIMNRQLAYKKGRDIRLPLFIH